ncbi:MAG TPA: hypothetical protein VFA85_01370 [Terriglobales bacterium]|nr:hypothetical protein [Terriglobales bacterium]
MARRRRGSDQIGTAGFSIIDNPTDASIENLDPDTTTGRVPAQDDNLEKGRTRRRRKPAAGVSKTNRK